MKSQTLSRVGLAMLAVSFAACADNHPAGVAPLTLDAAASLESEAARANTSGDAQSAASYSEAALALRAGVRPSEILVSVDGDVARYEAVVVAFVEALSPGDTALRRTLVAWTGGNRPLALLDVSTMGDVGSFSSAFEPASDPRSRAQGNWVNFVRDARYAATTGTAGIAVTGIGDECRISDSRHSQVRCAFAEFDVSVDGLFRLGGSSPRAGLDAVRIQTNASRVNGVIVGDGQDGRDHRGDDNTRRDDEARRDDDTRRDGERQQSRGRR